MYSIRKAFKKQKDCFLIVSLTLMRIMVSEGVMTKENLEHMWPIITLLVNDGMNQKQFNAAVRSLNECN